MAPIKFEENIKEKLEKRTLQPSGQAWNSLSDRLDVDAKNTPNKTLWFLGIAAILVGILFMVNMFFNTSETNNQTPVLVDTEAKEIETIQNNIVIESEETLVSIEEKKVEVDNISDGKIESHKTKKESVVSKNSQAKNSSIALEKNIQEPEEIISNSLLETPSVETELAQLKTQINKNQTETDIDALLKKAQQNIAEKSQTKTYSIDANKLLQDVEEDMDESFRAKVFETVKTNYIKVKTAVAQRND